MKMEAAQELANELADDYDPNEDRIAYMDRMKAAGFIILEPTLNQVFIDIDEDAQLTLFESQIVMLTKVLNKNIPYTIKESRNGLPGRHIIVEMPFKMDNCERIAWQAALGSDPKRELLSMVRCMREDVCPTLFVEKP